MRNYLFLLLRINKSLFFVNIWIVEKFEKNTLHSSNVNVEPYINNAKYLQTHYDNQLNFSVKLIHLIFTSG